MFQNLKQETLNSCKASETESATLDAPTSPLLDLPAELRNRTYFYVFCNYVAEPEPFKALRAEPAHRTPTVIALLYTNCQVYAETRLLLYLNFIFTITSTFGFKKFLNKRSQEQIGAIRYLQLQTVGCQFLLYDEKLWAAKQFKPLARLAKLKCIDVVVVRGGEGEAMNPEVEIGAWDEEGTWMKRVVRSEGGEDEVERVQE
ncbi:hypothetical protein CC86DRAFT_377994 [Ophiobolus disseminans]|uniref:Uncharacterized protein n=1 Tax=Ophiobolus disseminans TaxID=1469910 RepID=A0A6A7AEJ0_9PLEO|nr:hypothetical protein CC86DRAFT_377994 [Ophiobolus disseminans]